MSAPKILILGGGFGGVYTARRLEKLLKPEEAEITLVNRENYWVYQPMLPEVISGSIALTNVVSPIRHLCPRTHLVMREVEDIDLDARQVTVSPGFRPRRLVLDYDYLVIAVGGITDFFRMPGMLENAMPFRTLADAMGLRNHLIRALEEADVETDEELRRKLMTFVVGGGGFSGVEVVAEVNDFLRSAKSSYMRLRDLPVRCVLVHPYDRILPEMEEPLALFAQKILQKRGVEIVLNDRVAAATSEKVILKSGKEIPCKTVVSTVPSAPPPVIQKLECAKEKGKLIVNARMELQGREGQVWALGDCASVPTPAGKAPPTGQHATREAELAAANIAAAIRGTGPAEFTFTGLGSLASLGQGTAVAQIFGRRISGLPAFVLWRCIYLIKMPGLNRKFRIAVDWFTRVLFRPDMAQTRVTPEYGIKNQHFEPGEIVFNEGDLGDSVYVIEKGECEVLKGDDLKCVATLRAGQFFGEIALMVDCSRTATIRASTAMDVLLIPKRDFDKLRKSVPAFGEVFDRLAKERIAENTSGAG